MLEEVCGFLPYTSWHSEGWTPRYEALMEAVVKQTRTTWHPWWIGCNANMCPEDLQEEPLAQKQAHISIEAPGEGVSTCRSKGPNGECVERTYGYVIASHSLQGKIKNMEVVEDFESRPHKAVTFLVERDKAFVVWREQKCRKFYQDTAVGSCQDEAKVEEGREESEEEEENQKKEIDDNGKLLINQPQN